MDKTDLAGTASGSVEYLDMDLSFLDDLWKQVSSRPPNSFTIAEAAEQWGITYNAAKGRANKMADMGLLERTPPKEGCQAYFWEASGANQSTV